MTRQSALAYAHAMWIGGPFLLLFAACLFPEKGQSVSLSHSGRDRSFHVVIPPGHSTEKAWPLLLALHGGGGRGEGFDRWMTDGTLGKTAAARGFIVVYPEAYEKHWNDGRGLDARESHKLDVDDVGFLCAVVDRAVADWKADPKRVYVTGMSNGGLMSYRLLQERPDRFAAAAVVVANLPKKRAAMTPKRLVPLVIFNGTSDPLMPFRGGESYENIGLRRTFVGDFLSTEETCAYWAKLGGCEASPQTAEMPDSSPDDGTKVRRQLWRCPKGAEVALYAVEGGGHTWPGGKQYLSERLIGKLCRDIDATQILFEFFEKHRRE